MNEQQLQTEINQSKRNRRKTAYEEFLDEEPYFTGNKCVNNNDNCKYMFTYKKLNVKFCRYRG